jgi:hypothetical protein
MTASALSRRISIHVGHTPRRHISGVTALLTYASVGNIPHHTTARPRPAHRRAIRPPRSNNPRSSNPPRTHRTRLRLRQATGTEHNHAQCDHDRHSARDYPRACAVPSFSESRLHHHHNFKEAAKPPSFTSLSSPAPPR